MSEHEALRVYLATLAGGEPVGSDVEIRWKTVEGMRQEFMPVRAHRATAERIEALRDRGDVYVGACPRTRRSGRADVVARAWWLWADCDDDRAVAALERFEPWPSIVVASGTGGNCHAYWPLKDALKGEWIVRANRRLAHALGADIASTDRARILRPPGTLNFKHDPPASVECIRLKDATHTARDIVGHLADPPTVSAAPTGTPPTGKAPTVHDDLLDIPAAEYVPRLTGREPNSQGYIACPFHAGGQERTPSFKIYSGERWACFGCPPQLGAGREHLGGSIYTLAALLADYPLPLRGDDFLRVRDVLRRHFCMEKAA